MIENWIDELAEVWMVSDGRFKTVRSYKLVEKAEFPDSIDPTTLDQSPVALTIPGTLKAEYSSGGPAIGYWTGVTEFHVAPDLNKGRLPQLLAWYGLILKAASSHMKLNNTVELFYIEEIVGPLALQYGNEAAHWGFTVNWQVKERLESALTVSA